ncbi:MAG: hypothetical protein APF81_25720 [Desulfosporosinus sp. BRH_c37]|nr:MAG: hypothetical protein APF81_25720 [Desulfosporosinus sp. BRH_c37]
MSNKLKDIFSNKMFDLGGNLHFQDSESYKKFLEALQIVQNEGREVEVKGVSSLTTKVRDGEMEYPFLEQKGLTQLIIAPSTEDVPFVLNTEYGEKTVLFKRYQTTNEIILETDRNEVVYFKIVFIKNTSDVTFTYRTQPHLAKTVKDIVENYNTAIALLDTIFLYKDNQDLSDGYKPIYNTRESILGLESFFKRLYLLEQELELSFQPMQINDTENDEGELEELYLLLIEKKVIRLNAKLNATESTGMTMESGAHKLEVGSKIDLTFLGESEYTIYGQKISVHTANLLSNAIIKVVKEGEDGTIKVLYGDTDNRPMYISYTGFKTIDEAKQEIKTIMEHKEKYIEALTLNEYMGMISEKLKLNRSVSVSTL